MAFWVLFFAWPFFDYKFNCFGYSWYLIMLCVSALKKKLTFNLSVISFP